MSIRAVLLWPDPRLTEVCPPVTKADPTLIKDMFETMYAANGRGLAAPQIGVMQRLFVVDVTWKEGQRSPRVFINPTVEQAGDEIGGMEEQCLSIPDLPMPVERPLSVTLSWDDEDGVRLSEAFDGILARCILHELDHLDGRVILDHQTPADRTALESAYAC